MARALNASNGANVRFASFSVDVTAKPYSFGVIVTGVVAGIFVESTSASSVRGVFAAVTAASANQLNLFITTEEPRCAGCSGRMLTKLRIVGRERRASLTARS